VARVSNLLRLSINQIKLVEALCAGIAVLIHLILKFKINKIQDIENIILYFYDHVCCHKIL